MYVYRQMTPAPTRQKKARWNDRSPERDGARDPSNGCDARPRPHVRFFMDARAGSCSPGKEPNKVFMGIYRRKVPRTCLVRTMFSRLARLETGCRDSHPTKINPTPLPERVTAVNQFSGLGSEPDAGSPRRHDRCPYLKIQSGSKSTTRIDFPMASIPFLLPSRTACSFCPPGPPS